MHLKQWIEACIICATLLATPAAFAQNQPLQQGSQAADQPLAEIQQLIDQGYKAEAQRKLQALLKHDAKQYQAWFLLGVVEAEQQHYPKAVHAFRQVVALQPQLAEPHNNLAVIFDELGDYTAAIEELKASLKLNPDYLTARQNIGDLYIKLAADAYRQVLERSDRPELRARYARLLKVRAEVESNHPAPTYQPKKTAKAQPSQRHAVAAAAPEPAANHSATASPEAAIKQAIEAWRKAWSEQQIDAYFAAYADGFKGRKFRTRARWEAYKRRVILQRKYIHIRIDHLHIRHAAHGIIKATFVQHYRSNAYNGDDRKELWFARQHGSWRITREITLAK